MKHKVAIVTGGAGGIGSAICRAFAKEGVGVAVADSNLEAASELAGEIAGGGGEALDVQVEVRDEHSGDTAVQRVVDGLGRIDFLVHCAGNNVKAPLLDMSLEGWRTSLETHLVLFLCGDKSAYINGLAIPIDGGFLNSGFMPEPEE